MIIDSHTHIGKSFWGDFSSEYLLNIIDKNSDIAICSNLAGIDAYIGKDEIEANMDMLNETIKYPNIRPLAVCEVDRTNNADNIRKLLDKHCEFIGLKFHPEFTKLPANSNKYNDYLKVAEEYNIPCLFHSGHIQSKYSSPKLIYQKAKEFPNVKIILGHLSIGDTVCHQQAIEIMKESIEQETATLYTDTSWLEIKDVILLIKKLQNTKKGDYTDRILWASDAPVGNFNIIHNLYKDNITSFKTVITNGFKDPKLLQNLLCNNSVKLFNIKM